MNIPFFITGDLNLDLFKINDLNSNSTRLIELLTYNGIINTITKATRITRTSHTLLDIVGVGNFINNLNFSGVLTTQISDHYLLLNSFKLSKKSKDSNESEFYTKRLMGENNLNSLNDALFHADWSPVLNSNNTNVAYSIFIKKFLTLFNEHCPITKMKKNKRRMPIQPWMTPHLLRCRLRRDELHSIMQNDFNRENEIIYNSYRNSYYRLIRRAKIDFYKKSVRDAGKDSKKLWKVLKNVLGVDNKKETCTNLIVEGRKIENKDEIANSFNSYLSNLGANLTPEIPRTNKDFNDYLPPQTENSLFFEPLYPAKTINIIRSIKPKKSRDSNDISMFIICFCADTIAIPLTHIYNLSLSQAIFPSGMKISKVIILHKSGSLTELDNYRGLSLINNFSKPLERHVADTLVGFLNNNQFFSPSQFGFRKGFSTVHNILNLANLITEALSRGTSCMSIFLDVRKCFDLIDRNKLFDKLYNYGIRGQALQWFKSYYENRKQCVFFEGVVSMTLAILLGVLQGSVLGPILFVIYINDLVKCSVEVLLSLFADDAVGFLEKNNIIDLINHAKNVVPKLIEWYSSNSLLVHPGKTKCLIFSSPRERLNVIEQDFKNRFEVYIDLNNAGEQMIDKITKLDLVTPETGGFVKHLGILLDGNLNYRYHLNNLHSKVSKIIYSMKIMKHLLDKKHLRLLYNSYIKSNIEYCCLLLTGCSDHLLSPILKQQKLAVRIIENLPNNSHTAQYFKSNAILPLPLLIKFNCVRFMHKFKNGGQPEIFNDAWNLQGDRHNYRTRNRLNFAYVAGIDRNYLLRAPLHAMPTIFNNLPQNIREIENEKEFKQKCFTHFLNQIEF